MVDLETLESELLAFHDRGDYGWSMYAVFDDALRVVRAFAELEQTLHKYADGKLVVCQRSWEHGGVDSPPPTRVDCPYSRSR